MHRSLLISRCFSLPRLLVIASGVSLFSSTQSASHSSLLNLTNNLIFYQSIFDNRYSNRKKSSVKHFRKSKENSSTSGHKPSTTKYDHGLLIDRYLDQTTPTTIETRLDQLLQWTILLPCVLLCCSLYCLYAYRDHLVRMFRERHKRSVLKYSV